MDRIELVQRIHLGLRLAVLCFLMFGGLIAALVPVS
jgi:hypothetical protein